MAHRALVAVAAALLLAGCGGGTEARQETAQDQARSVRVGFVAMRPLELGITASGRLVPREEATVGSELSGYRVAQVFADEGDNVARGAVLARLDPALVEGEIARSRAQLAQAEAVAARARSEAARVRGLDQTGVIAQESIDQRRFAAREAEAGASAARAQLNDLLTRRSRLVLRAPVGGTVIARSISPGAISGGGTEPLFRIARDGLIELAAEVSEADLARVGRGAPVEVNLPSGGVVQGDVRTLAPQIQEANQLGIVRIRLPVRSDLRAGGTATARFKGVSRNVIAVPEAAVQFSGRGPAVMVLPPDNRARRVAVRTGQRSNGYVELLEGPPVGTRVLMSGAAFVLEGDLVRPIIGEPAPGTPAAAAANGQAKAGAR